MRVWRIALAAALAALSAPVAAETGNVRINDPSSGQTTPACNSQSDPALARTEDRIVAVWMDVGRCEAILLAPRPRVPDASLAGYARSADGGQTWADGGTLPAPAGGALIGAPAIAAGAGRFHAASAAVDGEGTSFVAVLRSTDGGETFSSPVDVSGERPSPQAFQSAPVVAADRDGRVHVAWRELVQGLDGSSRASVLFATSANHGVTFSAPMLISAYGQRSGDPRIVVGPNGEVYVAWYADGSLWITRSTDGGRTFRTPTLVGAVPQIGHREACVLGGWKQVLNGNLDAGQDPSLAVDLGPATHPRRGWLYVAAAAATRPGDEADVVLARSTDGGATWSELRRVNDDSRLVDQFNPEVAVRGDGAVAVTWYDRRLSGNVKTENWRLNVFAATSMDGGATFSRNVRVSDAAHDPARAFPIPTSDDVCPPPSRGALVETGGGFLAAWGDNRGGTRALPDLDVYAARL